MHTTRIVTGNREFKCKVAENRESCHPDSPFRTEDSIIDDRIPAEYYVICDERGATLLKSSREEFKPQIIETNVFLIERSEICPPEFREQSVSSRPRRTVFTLVPQRFFNGEYVTYRKEFTQWMDNWVDLIFDEKSDASLALDALLSKKIERAGKLARDIRVTPISLSESSPVSLISTV